MLLCVFPKYIFLYNYSIVIKLRKLNTDTICLSILIHSPYSNLTNCLNNVLCGYSSPYPPGNPGSFAAFSYHNMCL